MYQFYFALSGTWIAYGIGFTLFYKYKENIVIKNRRPGLVLIEQILVLITSSIETLKFDDEAYKIECRYVSFPVSVLGIPQLAIVLTRITLVYAYLLKYKKGDYKFTFAQISVFFWDQDFRLKKKNVFCMTLTWCLATIAFNVYGYHVTNDHNTLNTFCDIFPQMITYIANYTVGILLIIVSIQVIRCKLTDNIGMAFELVSFTISVISFSIIVNIYNVVSVDKFAFEYYVYTIALATLFFGIYFPLGVIWYNSIKIARYSPDSTDKLDKNIDWQPLLKISIKFYCQENVQFCISYNQYLEGNLTFDDLAGLYLMHNSPLELNISYELRLKTMDPDKRTEGLVEVYKHVLQIIRENLVPFLDDKIRLL